MSVATYTRIECERCERFAYLDISFIHDYMNKTIDEIETYVLDNFNTIFEEYGQCENCYNRYCGSCGKFHIVKKENAEKKEFIYCINCYKNYKNHSHDSDTE